MEKPAIFISHSSKDKEFILELKNKLDEITGRTLDIFMSSDGQSIPFGNNWLHKIEDGLQKSEIMFVFVTKNSLSSGWIYFEAGFGYSKGIKVIPVGFGVDIGGIKPPLNLLQGFNVISADGLNNFIKIINDSCDFSFPESFDESDYTSIISLSSFESSSEYDLNQFIDHIYLDISEKYRNIDEEVIRDLDEIMRSFESVLEQKDVEFSLSENDTYSQILTQGIDIRHSKDPFGKSHNGQIDIDVSVYNIRSSFELLVDLLEPLAGFDRYYLKIFVKDNVSLIERREDLASKLLACSPDYGLSTKSFGCFYYLNEDYLFQVEKRIIKRRSGELINYSSINVTVPINYSSLEAIISIINKLIELNIIE